MYLRDISLIPLLVGIAMLALVVLSQCYWFLQGWHFADRQKPQLRTVIRTATVLFFTVLVVGVFLDVPLWRTRIMWRSTTATALAALWISSTLIGYLMVCAVTAIVWIWRKARREVPASGPEREALDLRRRRFVLGAGVCAAALPLTGAAYGFLIGRLRFYVREVELPIHNLPPALDGMRITQLSDLHMSSYFSPADARRAVGMANELQADMIVVTGDFITSASDPLETCIAELSKLSAPLGVWGSNGNHEFYAHAEAEAARLFQRYGMFLLRQQSVELVRHAQPFNLIGMDYQSSHYKNGRLSLTLPEIAPLVRRDVPNILLSHNPNTFPAAAALGIELSLAGHTHGGQVRVEILDRSITPARFFTPYVAGPYRRPLGSAPDRFDDEVWAQAPDAPASLIYVNRGLGTIGAPVRIGVPPEISHFTLRRV